MYKVRPYRNPAHILTNDLMVCHNETDGNIKDALDLVTGAVLQSDCAIESQGYL